MTALTTAIPRPLWIPPKRIVRPCRRRGWRDRFGWLMGANGERDLDANGKQLIDGNGKRKICGDCCAVTCAGHCPDGSPDDVDQITLVIASVGVCSNCCPTPTVFPNSYKIAQTVTVNGTYVLPFLEDAFHSFKSWCIYHLDNSVSGASFNSDSYHDSDCSNFWFNTTLTNFVTVWLLTSNCKVGFIAIDAGANGGVFFFDERSSLNQAELGASINNGSCCDPNSVNGPLIGSGGTAVVTLG